MASSTVAEVLRQHLATLTPAERSVAREMLADYPRSGLETVARLAQRAGVSPPSVVRLVTKLGYAGYPDLQEHLRQELAARSMSPLQQYAERAVEVPRSARADGGALGDAEQVLVGGIRETFEGLPADRLEATLRLVCDPSRRILTIGGRFSSAVATYLHAHLQLLRPYAVLVAPGAMERAALLLDVGRRDVVVAYDFRRYQRDTVAFGEQAKDRGASLVVFTDPWLSPLANRADVVLPCTVTAPSPFDALTPAMALTEALIAAMAERLGDVPKARIEDFEVLQRDVLDGEIP